MRRYPFHPSRLVPVGVLVTALAFQACDSNVTDVAGYPTNGSFVLAVGTSSIPVTSGATAITFIKVMRLGGLTSDIIYSVTGAPVGLAVTVVTTSVADSFAVVVDASTTLDPGTYPVVVNAAAVGAAPQRETFAVTVSAPADARTDRLTPTPVDDRRRRLLLSSVVHCTPAPRLLHMERVSAGRRNPCSVGS
jgi:hypothetical protein